MHSRVLGVLLADPNVRETLAACNHACIIDPGRILKMGTPTDLAR